MADKVINTLTNISPLPSEGREKYLFPVVKTSGAVPEGGNFSLKDLLEPLETKDAAQDAAIAQKADKEAQRVIDEAQDDQIAKNRTSVKDLRMLSDTLLFQTDSDGFPIPSQVAHVHVDKPYCEGALTYEGKEIPEGTVDFTVEPKDMAEEGVVLKNSYIEDTAIAKTMNINPTSGHYLEYDKPLPIGRKYYARAVITVNTASIPRITMFLGNTADAVSALKSPEVGKANILSGVVTTTQERAYGMFYNHSSSTVCNITYKETVCIDITALAKMFPSYTDEQLKTILDASLPYISAQQSKTLGGVVRLENLVSNPTSTDGWQAGGAVRDFSVADGLVRGTVDYSVSSSSSWIYKNLSKAVTVGNRYYCSIKNFESQGEGKKVIALSKVRAVPINTVAIIEADVGNTPFVIGGSAGTNTLEMRPSFGMYAIDASDSLLDLWLSLNGYDTNEKKADWCNKHIPPFEGTFDLVLSMRNELTITAKCDGLMKSLTFKKAISDFRVTSVVESGEGYQKYADGTMICWGNSTYKITSSSLSSLGSLFEFGVPTSINFPVPFINTPTIQVTSKRGNGCIIETVTANTTSITHVWIFYPVREDLTVTFDWLAIGRWK